MDKDNTKAQDPSEDIELYYFTGTGNTLYIVKRLSEHLPEVTVKSVVPLIRNKDKVSPKGKIVGLCYPNHAGHLPIPMKMFLNRLHLKGNEYVFAICNSAFSRSFSPDDINKILRISNCELGAYFNVEMPDNHTVVNKNYVPQSNDDWRRCEEEADRELVRIREAIINQKVQIEKDKRPAPFPIWIDKTLRPLIFYLIQRHPSMVLKNALYADEKCIGCRTCERICPAYRISVNEGVPFFDFKKTCFGCYGCVNLCPQEAVQVGSKWYNGRSYSAVNGRYAHPYASANDIAKQKT